MKIPLPQKVAAAAMLLFVLNSATCLAEDLTITTSTLLRGDRFLISLKPGTVVEVVDRGDKTITVKYKGQTGTIPIPGSTSGATLTQAAAPQKTAAPTPSPAKKSLVVDAPQSTYGNLVKKAETNVAKHDANLVNPADAAMDPNAK